MNFEQYLAESFGFREVPFGMNAEADDGQFTTFQNLVITNFKYKDSIIRVSCSKDDGEIMFGDRTHGINPLRKARTGLDIYNRIAYVLLKVIEHAKVKEIMFQGDEDNGLRDLYDKFLRNPSFMKLFTSHGWKYQGEKYGGAHIFTKG